MAFVVDQDMSGAEVTSEIDQNRFDKAAVGEMAFVVDMALVGLVLVGLVLVGLVLVGLVPVGLVPVGLVLVAFVSVAVVCWDQTRSDQRQLREGNKFVQKEVLARS